MDRNAVPDRVPMHPLRSNPGPTGNKIAPMHFCVSKCTLIWIIGVLHMVVVFIALWFCVFVISMYTIYYIPVDKVTHSFLSFSYSLLVAVWGDCIPSVAPLTYHDDINEMNVVYRWTRQNNDNTNVYIAFHRSCIHACNWDVVSVRHPVWSKFARPIVPTHKNVPETVDVRVGRVVGLLILFGRGLSGHV